MHQSSARLAAEDAMRIADQDPPRAVPVAAHAVDLARREHDPAASAIAERAWGHSLLHCGEMDDAIRHLRRSIGHGRRAESAELVAEARMKLAFALAQRGQPGAALREVNAALPDLRGAQAARALAQRAIVLHLSGRLDAAFADFQSALPVLRRSGDLLGVQRMLIDRAFLQSDRHCFAEAKTDLLEAEGLAVALDRELTVGIIAENLGKLDTLRGDVPAALGHLDRAERIIGAHGAQLGWVHRHRAELLLSVAVATEASESAERAVRTYQREGRLLSVPEARLLQSQAAFLRGDWATAVAHARRAAGEFTRQGRREWAAYARLAVLRAQSVTGSVPPGAFRRAAALVDTLAAAGWPAATLEARLVAGALAIERGRHAEGRAYLGLAAPARRRGPAARRARGWYAEALLRQDRGDVRGTVAAARAGLRILDEHAAALGATDLRVHSAAHRAQLAELGLRTALASGRPAGVFEWAERGRASRLRHRPVLPAADPVLAAMLTELRAIAVELQQRARTDPALVHQQVALERRIRDHSRRHLGAGGGVPATPVPVRVAAHALGSRALVEFIALDGILHALSLVDGRLRLRVIAPVAQPADLIARLPFALHRLARKKIGEPSQSAAAVLLRDAATRLDALLLGPLPELEDRPLVVVPTGVLHSVPWSILPSCRGRPVTVSASATLWHTASSGVAAPGPAVVTAGPGLSGARKEAVAVAAIHGCTPLVDEAASVESVLAELATAGIAHLAAHGSLTVDNPLFSRLRLHDGPLLVHDVERLASVPGTVVLASCDSGRSVVCTGDELLGLSATFIARGAAQLVASVVPVPDAETTPLMVSLHRELAAGRPAASALATAQLEQHDRGPAELAAAAGFVSFGA